MKHFYDIFANPLKRRVYHDGKAFNVQLASWRNSNQNYCGASEDILSQIDNFELCPADDVIPPSLEVFNWDCLHEFSLMFVEAPAKVLRVIDGDTIIIGAEIQSAQMSKTYYTRKNKQLVEGKNCEAIGDVPLMMKLRCRLYGVDTPELSTIDGRKVAALVREELEGAFIKCKFVGIDKWGRHLIVVGYRNASDRWTNFNEFLVEEGLANIYYL